MAGLLLSLAGFFSLFGCGPNMTSVATGPLPAQKSPTGSPVAKNFWLQGTTMGCHLPSGQFFTYQFNRTGTRIEGEKSLEMAALIPGSTGLSDAFSLQTSVKNQQFKIKKPESTKESHLLHFYDGDTRFTCLLINRDGYLSDPGAAPGLSSIPGQWQCNGDFGPIVIDEYGRFARSSVQGRIVFSSPDGRPDNVTLYLLGDIRKNYWVGSYSEATLDASALPSGKVRINGQDCRRA